MNKINMPISETNRDLLICIDSYDNKNFVGYLWQNITNTELSFNNLTQLLFLINQHMEELDYPQAPVEIRSFRKNNVDFVAHKLPVNIIEPRGKKATFRIKIIFRQNVSYQGIVKWIDEDQEEMFRSALELVMLMDSALED